MPTSPRAAPPPSPLQRARDLVRDVGMAITALLMVLQFAGVQVQGIPARMARQEAHDSLGVLRDVASFLERGDQREELQDFETRTAQEQCDNAKPNTDRWRRWKCELITRGEPWPLRPRHLPPPESMPPGFTSRMGPQTPPLSLAGFLLPIAPALPDERRRPLA